MAKDPTQRLVRVYNKEDRRWVKSGVLVDDQEEFFTVVTTIGEPKRRYAKVKFRFVFAKIRERSNRSTTNHGAIIAVRSVKTKKILGWAYLLDEQQDVVFVAGNHPDESMGDVQPYSRLNHYYTYPTYGIVPEVGVRVKVYARYDKKLENTGTIVRVDDTGFTIRRLDPHADPSEAKPVTVRYSELTHFAEKFVERTSAHRADKDSGK